MEKFQVRQTKLASFRAHYKIVGLYFFTFYTAPFAKLQRRWWRAVFDSWPGRVTPALASSIFDFSSLGARFAVAN